MQAQPTTPWISPRVALPEPRARCFAFPYAGAGGSALRSLSKAMPPGMEFCPIELPGRWSRVREPLHTSMRTLQDSLWAGLSPLFDLPCVFFGYSLGALVAFELLRRLRREGRPLPRLLVAAARRAPQVSLSTPPTHRLPDAEFLSRITEYYGGVPAQVRESPDLMELVLPVLRADMTVFETYAYSPEAPLDCPIMVMGARDDATVSDEALEEWQAQTVRPLVMRWFTGGHFFINSAGSELVGALGPALAKVMP